MRINKYLADKGFATRRGADKLIEEGKVKINGKKAQIGQQVESTDIVEVNVRQEKKYKYFAYYKPRDIITHSPQNKGEREIKDIVKDKDIFPIGRLDKDSEGLMILTNDGRITDRLLNPKYYHEKEYEVRTRIPISDFALSIFKKGVDLGDFKTRPNKVKRIDEKTFLITITEGKKHQIRRMCDAVNVPIDNLKRIRFMNIKIGDLKENEKREIKGEELSKLLASIGL